MKDIDFDELDRAVSSALEPMADKAPAPAEGGATGAAPAAAPEAKPEVPEESPVAADPVSEPVAEAPAPVTAPAAKTPLAVKRRGQFMDVVHPSSDMTGKPEDAASALPSRKVTLKPLNTSVTPEAEPESTTPSVEETPAPATVEEPVEPQVPTETVEPAAAEQVMPDPLDVMSTQEETKEASVAEATTIEDTPVEASETTENEAAEDETAPTTPFLADTKVDKRPLDAFSAEEAPVEAMAAEPAPAAEPLPPELQADVIAVESNPSERAEEPEAPAAADEAKSEEPGFNASIPQQYASTESKSDDDHSIFDTKEYHQPLAPAKTKKRGLPGWLIATLIIFLLAAIGAAGGYFWFQYGL